MRISRETMYLWDVAAKEDPMSLLLPGRNYAGLNKQQSQLRVWLPEMAKISLLEVVKQQRTSLTVFLTEYFATYLYGYHELLLMRDQRIGLYELVPILPGIRYNVEAVPDFTPKLGKNLYAIKIFIAECLKNDLERGAERLTISLGEFSRALICQHLFGCDYGLPDNEINRKDQIGADAWETSESDDENWEIAY